MASPPAKRQRRLIVLSSDDSDGEENGMSKSQTHHKKLSNGTSIPASSDNECKAAPTSLPSRTKTKAASKSSTRTSQRPSKKTTPTSSPEKYKRKVLTRNQNDHTKSIHTFFQTATEEQRWSRKVESTTADLEDIEGDDLIEDDSLDEALLQLPEVNAKDDSGLDRRKMPQGAMRQIGLPPSDNLPSVSQRFINPIRKRSDDAPRNVSATSASMAEDQLPWPDQYAPTNLDELAIHKKKATDVAGWLDGVFQGKDRRRLLVLKGPAGSGKTTTVALLSKSLDFDIIEWKNPTASEYSAQGYVSIGAQFNEFLGRSEKFKSLDFGSSTSSSTINDVPTSANPRKRVILVEEFPSTLTRSSSALDSFRSAIRQYLAASIASHPGVSIFAPDSDADPLTPVIMIISETLLTSSTASADSFTAHRLLGPEISNHPGVGIIEFNPVAPTFINKALELVIRKEARHSKRKRIPGPAVIKRLAEMGDIRSAIGSLEFLCLRGDQSGDWGGRVAAKMKKSDKDGLALTQMEKESLEMVTQRESTLGMFHAVGKVVYNKREDAAISQPKSIPPPRPPDYFLHQARPKISQVNVDELIDETGTDTQTFISALHENYILSCDGPLFTDSLIGCIDSLSESDLLSPGGRRNFQASRSGVGSARDTFQGYGGGIDMLRQDEISFQVAVRGLLFELPCPVKRKSVASTSTGARNDAYKMFYPTSLRIWRQTEEIESLLNVWSTRLMHGGSKADTLTSPARIKRSEGVESWTSRTLGSSSLEEGREDEPDEVIAPRANVARGDLLLERLPYLAQISKHKPTIQQIERITQFHGIGGQSEDFEDDDDGGGLEIPDLDQGVEKDLTSPRKRGRWQGKGAGRSFGANKLERMEEKEAAIEKLVVSDDDIEDD